MHRKFWLSAALGSALIAATIGVPFALGFGGSEPGHASVAVDQSQHYTTAQAQAVANGLVAQVLNKAAESRSSQGSSALEHVMAVVSGRPVQSSDLQVYSSRYVGASTDGAITDQALRTNAATTGIWVFTYAGHHVQVDTPGVELADGTIQVDLAFADGTGKLLSAGASVYPEGITPKPE
jgi:hypothetical protein